MSFNYKSNFNSNNYNITLNSSLESNIYNIIKNLKQQYNNNINILNKLKNLKNLLILNNFKITLKTITLSKLS